MKMSFQTCGLTRDSSSSKIQEEDFRLATIPDFPQEAAKQQNNVFCLFCCFITSNFAIRTSNFEKAYAFLAFSCRRRFSFDKSWNTTLGPIASTTIVASFAN